MRDPWLRGHLLGRLQGPSRTESMTLSGTAPGWEPPEDPDTGSECSHPEVTPSPRFVAAKTQTNQSGKKAPGSVVRCTTLLHRTPPATQTQTFRTPNSGSPASKATAGTDNLYYPCLPGFPPTACCPARTRLEFHHALGQIGTHASGHLCNPGRPLSIGGLYNKICKHFKSNLMFSQIMA